MSDYFRLQAASPPVANAPSSPRFAAAKACILLFLYGSPSQLELAIRSGCAGRNPRRARLDPIVIAWLRCMRAVAEGVAGHGQDTVVRSMTHPYPIHGVAYATTGTPIIDIPMELNPRDGRHHPYIGSVVDYLRASRSVSDRRRVPDNIALPFQFQPSRRRSATRGPYGASSQCIQSALDGVPARATKIAVKTLQDNALRTSSRMWAFPNDSRFTLAWRPTWARS